MNLDDRLAVGCMCFYMGYIRGLGFIEDTCDADFIRPSQSFKPCRWLLYRLMLRDLNPDRVRALLRVEALERNLMNYHMQAYKAQTDELKRAYLHAFKHAPPYVGEPWPLSTIIITIPSQPLT